MKVNFYDTGSIQDDQISFVVIVSKYKGQWVLVRHRKRETLEVPGGHREPGEDLEAAARRELYEETGALEFELFPVYIYSVSGETGTSYGKLYFADVRSKGELPQSEIQEVRLLREFPEGNLTYPLIQPFLFQKVMEFLDEVKESDTKRF